MMSPPNAGSALGGPEICHAQPLGLHSASGSNSLSLMGRIVIGTIGSRGDLFPMLGLAKSLGGRGPQECVATPLAHQAVVEDEDIEFHPIGPSLGTAEFASQPRLLTVASVVSSGSYTIPRVHLPNLDRYVADLAGVAAGADLHLAHPALIAAPIAAELYVV